MRWPFTLANDEGILFLFFGFISSQVPIGKKKQTTYDGVIIRAWRSDTLPPTPWPTPPLPPPTPHNGLKKRQISRSLLSTQTQENSNGFWFLVKLVSILGSIFQLEY